jgi:isocitrate dehydrogenase (NAD+)
VSDSKVRSSLLVVSPPVSLELPDIRASPQTALGVLSTPRGRATKKSLNMELRWVLHHGCYADISLTPTPNRTELDLFANVIVCKTPVGIATRHTGVDIVIVRQNTEAEYSGLEHEVRATG